MVTTHPADIIQDISEKDLKGMKALFINMPLRESAVPNTTPQGPLLLATNLRDTYGVDVSVVDLNGYRIKDELADKRGLEHGRHLTQTETFNLLEAHIKKYGEPDFVALSGKITTLKWQEVVVEMVRAMLPDTFIVSGNGLATELKTGLFNYIPELDAVAHSEGDDVIVKVAYDAKLIKDKGMEKAIQSGGLKPYYLGEISGKHRFMYEGNRPKDLNAIPFADLDLLKEDVFGYQMLEYYIGNPVWGKAANNSSATSFEMKRSTGFVSSRGCPFQCSYCHRGSQGERNYGIRTAENLAEEFKLHIDKYKVDFIGMSDDNFAVNYQRCMDIVPHLRPLNMRWGTHLRLDEAAGLRPSKDGEKIFESPKRIDAMSEAGCQYIGFGAESASPKVLTAMQKGGFILKNGTTPIKVDGKTYEFPLTMIEGIKNCEYAGIHANCTWILGYTHETLDELKMSVAFIKWQNEFYKSVGKTEDSLNCRMFCATAYPGTAMCHDPKVKQALTEVFKLNFDEKGNTICDENLHKYILELDDATKLLTNPETGQPLNYSDMPDDVFIKCRELVDSGRTFEILNL